MLWKSESGLCCGRAKVKGDVFGRIHQQEREVVVLNVVDCARVRVLCVLI